MVVTGGLAAAELSTHGDRSLVTVASTGVVSVHTGVSGGTGDEAVINGWGTPPPTSVGIAREAESRPLLYVGGGDDCFGCNVGCCRLDRAPDERVEDAVAWDGGMTADAVVMGLEAITSTVGAASAVRAGVARTAAGDAFDGVPGEACIAFDEVPGGATMVVEGVIITEGSLPLEAEEPVEALELWLVMDEGIRAAAATLGPRCSLLICACPRLSLGDSKPSSTSVTAAGGVAVTAAGEVAATQSFNPTDGQAVGVGCWSVECTVEVDG